MKFPLHTVQSFTVGHLISMQDHLAIPHYIIIIATQQTHDAHSEIVREVLSYFQEIHSWTIDMDDEDRVIRVISQQNISTPIVTRLGAKGIDSSIMGIFR